eukprot:1345813-Karenia_brevis.AAC.1
MKNHVGKDVMDGLFKTTLIEEHNNPGSWYPCVKRAPVEDETTVDQPLVRNCIIICQPPRELINAEHNPSLGQCIDAVGGLDLHTYVQDLEGGTGEFKAEKRASLGKKQRRIISDG